MARNRQTQKKSGCASAFGWVFLIILLFSILTPSHNENNSSENNDNNTVVTNAEVTKSSDVSGSSASGSITAFILFAVIGGTVFAVVKGIKNQRMKREINSLAEQAERHLQTLTSAQSATGFVNAWESLQRISEQIASYEGKVRINADLNEVKNNLKDIEPDCQWYLRNAIDRHKMNRIHDITVAFKNSKEHKERAYWAFMEDLDYVCDRFSDETKEFADNCADAVYRATGLFFEPHEHYFTQEEQLETYRSVNQSGGVQEQLFAIDNMEGHDFENYCAELLKKNGFSKVSVTRGSGDQGVDILAEKGGIRYAIQCKCYTSDLSNKPIQEVHAGKNIYNCHVGVVLTNRFFTAGAKKAAESTNTLLWDRTTLAKLIENALE